MNKNIHIALIITAGIVTPIVFWDKINWLRFSLICFEVATILIVWITYKYTK